MTWTHWKISLLVELELLIKIGKSNWVPSWNETAANSKSFEIDWSWLIWYDSDFVVASFPLGNKSIDLIQSDFDFNDWSWINWLNIYLNDCFEIISIECIRQIFFIALPDFIALNKSAFSPVLLLKK